MPACSCNIWDLVPWLGIKPGPSTLRVWSLTHWNRIPGKSQIQVFLSSASELVITSTLALYFSWNGQWQSYSQEHGRQRTFLRSQPFLLVSFVPWSVPKMKANIFGKEQVQCHTHTRWVGHWLGWVGGGGGVEEERGEERERGSRTCLRLKDQHQKILDFLLQKFACKIDFSESPMFLGKSGYFGCPRTWWFICVPEMEPMGGLQDGEGNDNSLRYSHLDNPMDRGDLWAIVHGLQRSQACLCN